MRGIKVARAGGGRRPLFYGWWIVLTSACLQVLGSGFYYYGLGTFFLPLTDEFGWPRALTSSAFSLDRLVGCVVAPAVGFAFDRVGPRKLVALGVALAGAGFILFSQVQSFAGFALSVLLMSSGFSCGFASTAMAAVANWFHRKRTIALGLLMAGSGIGGLMVPLLAWLIGVAGWRTAALLVGLVMWIVGLPLSRVIRHRPEPYGLLPDGEVRPGPLFPSPRVQGRSPAPGRGSSALPTDGRSGTEVVADGSMAAAQALRTRAFWLLALSASLTFIAQSALVVHAIPHLTGAGLPPAVAASAVAAMTVFSIVGRVGFGWVGDRFEKRYVIAMLFGLQVAGLAVFAVISEPWHLVLFLALYAPSYGGAIPLRPSIQGDYFGRRAFGAIQGVMMSCTSVGGMVGPVFAGLAFDLLGSYRLAFLTLAAVAAASVPAMLLVPRLPARAPVGCLP